MLPTAIVHIFLNMLISCGYCKWTLDTYLPNYLSFKISPWVSRKIYISVLSIKTLQKRSFFNLKNWTRLCQNTFRILVSRALLCKQKQNKNKQTNKQTNTKTMHYNLCKLLKCLPYSFKHIKKCIVNIYT